MPIDIPNIDNINEVNPVYRDGIAAIFKCTRDGWVELLTGARPASEENSPTYEYTPHSTESNLCEMRSTASQEHVYWDHSQIPKIPISPPFSCMVFERDLEGSGQLRVPFGVNDFSGNSGWVIMNRGSSNTNDVGWSKIGKTNVPYTSLESANVETHIAIAVYGGNTSDGYTDEGTQNSSNTTSLATTGIDRVTIGGWYKTSAFQSSEARSKIGPYIILWDRALSADQITNLAANPALLKDPTLLSPMQLYSWLYGAATPTTDTSKNLLLLGVG